MKPKDIVIICKVLTSEMRSLLVGGDHEKVFEVADILFSLSETDGDSNNDEALLGKLVDYTIRYPDRANKGHFKRLNLISSLQ